MILFHYVTRTLQARSLASALLRVSDLLSRLPSDGMGSLADELKLAKREIETSKAGGRKRPAEGDTSPSPTVVMESQPSSQDADQPKSSRMELQEDSQAR